MSWLSKVGAWLNAPPPAPVPLRDKRSGAERGRGTRSYDAASSSRPLIQHWAKATSGDANTLISADLATTRNRMRYEIRNSPMLQGMLRTYAVHCVGIGPRLQLKGPDPKLTAWLEDEFGAWAMDCERSGETGLGEMLGLGVKGLCDAGAILMVRTSDPDSPHPVKLKYSMVETDRLDDVWDRIGQAYTIGGIKRDRWGKPVEYYIWDEHPGAASWQANPWTYTAVPAADVIHYRHVERPGQSRGFPELASSLTGSAQLRDYWLATLDAARFAAYLAGFVQTTSDQIEPEEAESMDILEIERNQLMTLPAGYTVGQLDAKHPNAQFKDFRRENIGEMARPIGMPLNIALANSENYNYASGRLDHQSFFMAMRVEQYFLSLRICLRMFSDWLREAALIPGYVPGDAFARAGVPRLIPIRPRDDQAILSGRFAARAVYPGAAAGYPDQIAWYWQAPKHVDPEKEANAQKTRLEGGMTTYSTEYAEEGKDWEREFEQRAAEIRRATELAEDYDCEPQDIAPHLFPSAKPATGFGQPSAPPAPPKPDGQPPDDGNM